MARTYVTSSGQPGFESPGRRLAIHPNRRRAHGWRDEEIHPVRAGSPILQRIPPVGSVARKLLIDRSFTQGSTGQNARPLLRNQVIPEAMHVLRAVQQGVDEGCEALLSNHDRPCSAFGIAMDRAAENPSHNLIHHAVVRAALVIALLESLGEQQSADEIPDGDVAAAEL